MIYDRFGCQVEIIEVKSPILVVVRYSDDRSIGNLDPRFLKADGGQQEIIEAAAKTYTHYKQLLIAPLTTPD